MVAAAAAVVAIERNALDPENALESVVHGERSRPVENVPVAGNANIGSVLANVNDTMMIVTERKNVTETDTQKEIVATDIKASPFIVYLLTCSSNHPHNGSTLLANHLSLSSTSPYPSCHSYCTLKASAHLLVLLLLLIGSHTCSNL